jgi:hypothetical protein
VYGEFRSMNGNLVQCWEVLEVQSL